MNNKRLIKTFAAMIFVLHVCGMNVYPQSMDELLNQLCGKVESPERNAVQLTEAYQAAVNHLLPLMSAEDVNVRYNSQITLQNMGSYAARPDAEMERETLAKVMIKTLDQKNIPGTVYHWIVQQIGRIGKAESVPTLVKLMSSEDAHLRDYARQALVTNPDPGAADALVKALSSTKDITMKIGLLNALGLRGSELAVPQIVRALDDQNEMVAAAAATALSHIGGQSSIQALIGVIENPASPIYMEAAQSLVEIAQRMITNGDKFGAVNIYGWLYEYATQMARDPSSSPNLSGVRAAAVTGLIVCRPNEMAPGIVQLMRDEDPMVCIAAINGARLSSYSTPTQALVELMPSLGSDAQIQILALLGDKAETSKIDAITSLLNSGDETVCTAAVDALSQIGSEASANALMETAVNREGALRNAALKDLTVVTGVGVEEFIREKARSGDVKIRVVAIPLLGKRQIPGAIQVLYGYAADKNEEIQSASFQGLSEIAGSVDVASLIGLITQTKSEKARETGLSTLRTVLSVSQDKESATKTMITQIDKSKKDLKPLLLGTLDALGGSAALGVANNAALSSDEAMRDAGIRTMSEWPDFEATEKLLAIASNPKTSLTHYVLALRGAVRLIQNSNSAPLEDREKLCLAAFDGTRRNEEKILVISAMGSIPSTAIGERLLELAKDESLKAEAGLAAIVVANAMLRTDQTAAQKLAQKILDLNISDDINGYAQSIIKGERIRFGGGGR